MFSRSEKTEDVIDPMAEPSEQRSPLMLAGLAGLLAIAGAFLLIWYLNNDDGDVASPATPDGSAEVITDPAEASRQVLVVVETIPRGTSVSELIENPTVFLSARAVPEQFVAATAITSVAELSQLEGFVLASDALPGEQLLRGRFRDPNDFDADTETFLEAATLVEIPAGHHAVVMELPAANAFGGNLGVGDKVTVIANLRISPPESESTEISLVVLNEIVILNVQNQTLDSGGQLSNDFNQAGVAAGGDITLTVAVTPEELTDLTYAMTYGEILLATAVEGLTNEDGPRAVTTINEIVGDDGIWLSERDDDLNLVDIIGRFPEPDAAEGQSIQLDLPEDDGGDDDENIASPDDDGTDAAVEDAAVEDAGDS